MAPISDLTSSIFQFSDGLDLGVGEACGAVVALGDDLASLFSSLRFHPHIQYHDNYSYSVAKI